MSERLSYSFGEGRAAAEAWFEAHGWVVWALGALSVVTLVVSALLIPRLIAGLPRDYYLRAPKSVAERGAGRSRWLHWLAVGGRNLCGLVLLVAGLAMLVLPGQGLLTLLAALALLDFPYKRELEMRLVGAPGVVQLVTWLRRRAGKRPLRLP